MTIYGFDELETSDLVVDAEYCSGTKGNIGDDPINRLLPVGNQGGFRFKGQIDPFDIRLCVLYTSGYDPDWPDYLDPHTGQFVYFGDNKSAGRDLHTKSGNQILRAVFERAGEPEQYVPPFFIFERTGERRNVRFRGLAVPGHPNVGHDSDLVAIWRTTKDQRFQNYRAVFTVLDIGTVPREWIQDLADGNPDSEHSPAPWFEWSIHRNVKPLEAPRTIRSRSKEEQLPSDRKGMDILRAIHKHFAPVPTAFEACAVAIWKMIEPSVQDVTITQASRDGGRDAIGRHALGPKGDRVMVDFALEAKCYDPDKTTVGVADVSRLISRLLHRQYGVLVTTSCLGAQPYQEIRADGHPVVVVSGVDIVDALSQSGITDVDSTKAWLVREFKL